MAADQQDADLRFGQRPLDFGMEPVTDVDEFLVEPDPVPDGADRFQRRDQLVPVGFIFVAETDEDVAIHRCDLLERLSSSARAAAKPMARLNGGVASAVPCAGA